MELALEFGWTVEMLKARMTEGELGRWMRLARRKPLPTRRIEFYLANLARIASMGDKPLGEYLLFEREHRITQEVDVGDFQNAGDAAVAIGEAFGAKVVKLGKNKRRAA